MPRGLPSFHPTEYISIPAGAIEIRRGGRVDAGRQVISIPAGAIEIEVREKKIIPGTEFQYQQVRLR